MGEREVASPFKNGGFKNGGSWVKTEEPLSTTTYHVSFTQEPESVFNQTLKAIFAMEEILEHSTVFTTKKGSIHLPTR